ncbi:hypothetical protein HD554DRAFT_2042815 [Boletus coccyginus]|nr:hypothetical protein HD554DRAFT_2042815 [Boletus coccyginus]
MPDHRALRFSPDRNYDVKQGDAIVVIRGDYRGKYGTVTRVCLDNRVLHVDPLGRGPAFQLPITHFAHAFSSRDDEDKQHVRKEVLIVNGEFRGWRGTLTNVTRDKCTVLRGVSSWHTCSTDSVVVRGSQTRLSGRALTPQEILVVAGAFARAEISDTSDRQRTPPPSTITAQTTAPNPWEVDESDRELRNTPALKVHGFLLHSSVLKSLETLHAVFQITSGRDGYIQRLAKTRVPNPLQTKEGTPVPKGQIAVFYTARTKGARLVDDIMSETWLKVYRPVKKNTFCMVIEGKAGGECIGSVLSVTRVFKDDKVSVRRLDGTQAAEDFLPMTRVIVVEPRS